MINLSLDRGPACQRNHHFTQMSSYAPAEPTRPSAPELPPWDSEQPFEDAREAQPVLDAAQDDDDDEQLGDLTDETDLYALLNIDRSATEEDIRNAYRRLALMLHPDKARDPEAKRAADRNFAAVQHAYDGGHQKDICSLSMTYAGHYSDRFSLL